MPSMVTERRERTSGVPVSEICQHRLLLFNHDAIRHLFEVSAGLDSLVPGEGQILTQVRQVVKVGRRVAGFGRNIIGLFNRAINVGKEVRASTNIAVGAVSVSSVAVELALKKLPKPSHATARLLVIGAGEMGKLLIKHLVAKGCTKMAAVRRVLLLTAKQSNVRKSFTDPSEKCWPMLRKQMWSSSVLHQKVHCFENVQTLPSVGPEVGGFRVFTDISVPRNVAWRDSLETTGPTIKKLRAYAERIRDRELKKFLSDIGDDLPEKTRTVVVELTGALTNKLLGGPMPRLRCDGNDGRTLSETLENMRALNCSHRDLGVEIQS
ncbi:LOW QUALITY PROTEIN: hypothetical protein Cgig2_025723 [Carnegiea gigantea]|uniref:glutamyl-tRNA reductase n=1 Tax=Carnegiea gigantea TaxID=171969 RepID=A0A9Q1Q4N9_9CARY|nr:LOW QUALITY PROTEIN: hypothetical protein Cgig2_025723 [Carnegiea gigantea]